MNEIVLRRVTAADKQKVLDYKEEFLLNGDSLDGTRTRIDLPGDSRDGRSSCRHDRYPTPAE